MSRCEDLDLQVWRCEDLDLQVWGCEDQDQQMWRSEDQDQQIRSEDQDQQMWRSRSADKVWRSRSADVKEWRSRSADVKEWRSRSADVKEWRSRSADVKEWRSRSADVKKWRSSITAAFLRRTLRRRSREKSHYSKIDSNLWSPGCLSLEIPPYFTNHRWKCPGAACAKLLRAVGLWSCNWQTSQMPRWSRRSRPDHPPDPVIPSGCQPWSNKPQTAVELGRYHLKV